MVKVDRLVPSQPSPNHHTHISGQTLHYPIELNEETGSMYVSQGTCIYT